MKRSQVRNSRHEREAETRTEALAEATYWLALHNLLLCFLFHQGPPAQGSHFDGILVPDFWLVNLNKDRLADRLTALV